MTSQDFTIWMKGFAAAANEFTLTPKQWDDLKDQLNKVEDYGESQEELENDFFGHWEGTPNGTDPGMTITTTPGTGYITVSNPNSFPNSFTTSTATSLPSGSTIRYTNSTDKTLLND